MSMYNKIFTKILDSSVWLESTPTRIVWLTFIAAMDETGYCQFASIGNLAARARVTMDEAKKAVAVLEAPDDESADPDNEGRRVERVQGGWIVLNAAKYRALVTRANIQEKVRERVRRFRERKRTSNSPVTECNGEVTVGNQTVTTSETEAYTETEQKQDPIKPSAFVDSWNRLRGKLPKVEKFSESRKKKVQARIRQGITLEQFEQAVRCCTEKPFLRGDSGWCADFDWLVGNDNNIEKAIQKPYAGNVNGKPEDKYDALFSDIERRHSQVD